jgi:hypothetical protein
MSFSEVHGQESYAFGCVTFFLRLKVRDVSGNTMGTVVGIVLRR